MRRTHSPPPIHDLPHARIISSPPIPEGHQHRSPGRVLVPAVDPTAVILQQKDDVTFAYQALRTNFAALQAAHEDVLHSQLLPLQNQVGQLAASLSDEVAHRDGLAFVLAEKEQLISSLEADLQRQKLMEYVLSRKKEERIEELENVVQQQQQLQQEQQQQQQQQPTKSDPNELEEKSREIALQEAEEAAAAEAEAIRLEKERIEAEKELIQQKERDAQQERFTIAIEGAEHRQAGSEAEYDPVPSEMISRAIYDMEKSEFQQTNSRLQDELERATKSLGQKEGELLALRDQVVDHENTLTLYKSRNTDVSHDHALLDAALKQSEQDAENIKHRLAITEEKHGNEIEKLREHLALLAAELDKEKDSHKESLCTIHELQADYADVVVALKADVDAGAKKVRMMEDEREATQRVLAQLRQAVSQAALEGHACETRAHTLQDELDVLQQQHDVAAASGTALSSRLEAAERERAALASQHDAMLEQQAAFEEKHEELARSHADLQRVAKEQERLQESERNKAAIEAEQMQHEMVSLIEKLERAATAQSAADDEASRLQATIARERLACEEERRAAAAAEAASERLRTEAQRARRDVAQLRAVLEHQSGIFEGVEGALSESTLRLEDQAQLIEASKHVEHHLQEELKAREDEIARTRHGRDIGNAALAERDADALHLARTVGDMETIVGNLTANLRASEAAKAAAEACMIQEEHRAVAAEAAARILQARVDALECDVMGARGVAAAACDAMDNCVGGGGGGGVGALAKDLLTPRERHGDTTPRADYTAVPPNSVRRTLLPATPGAMLAKYEAMRLQGASPSAAVAVVASTPAGGRYRSVSPRRL